MSRLERKHEQLASLLSRKMYVLSIGFPIRTHRSCLPHPPPISNYSITHRLSFVFSTSTILNYPPVIICKSFSSFIRSCAISNHPKRLNYCSSKYLVCIIIFILSPYSKCYNVIKQLANNLGVTVLSRGFY